MNSFGPDKAVPLRYPSTANLMVDSADRNATLNPSPWNFQITKTQNTQYGFFSRIGTTEVVLEWCQDNISSTLKNQTISFDLSGIAPNTYSGSQTITLPSGLYNAKEAYDALAYQLSDLSGTTGATFTIEPTFVGGSYSLVCSGAFFDVDGGRLAIQLDIDNAVSVKLTAKETGILLDCPDLRPYRYIDFVSPQLTYAQDVKDNSTAKINYDVLCRWYFSEETQEAQDAYGFPILMGYTKFCRRRLFNPPKQIKWDNNLSVSGTLQFQVFGDDSSLVVNPSGGLARSNWLMTLQLSEN